MKYNLICAFFIHILVFTKTNDTADLTEFPEDMEQLTSFIIDTTNDFLIDQASHSLMSSNNFSTSNGANGILNVLFVN